MKLKNKVSVVTGGGRGIGAAICQEFANEGAMVAVCDINQDSADETVTKINNAGGKAKSWIFDVSKREEVENAAGEIKDTFGPVDIWVNNAGISKIIPFLDCTDEIWDMTMAINLKGVFLGSQAAVKQMLPKKSGVIINMSSQSGRVGGSQYQAYCASKFGVIGFTQSLSKEFAGKGIRVNAICPGVVFTPMWDQQKKDYAKKRNMKPEEVKPYFEKRIPLGRIGTEEEVAHTAVFLASKDAEYITGQAINVSGGAVMH